MILMTVSDQDFSGCNLQHAGTKQTKAVQNRSILCSLFFF